MKRQNHKLTDTLTKVTNQHRKKPAADWEELLKIQRLFHALARNFPNVTIGILNRKLQFAPLDGPDTLEAGPTARNNKKNHPQLDQKILTNLKKAFEGENVYHEVNANGKFYQITAIPLLDGNSNVNEILCVIQNLTEQKHMEVGLLKALEKEKELSELKSRFVTMASHEFRTPLTSILASTFLLENLDGDDYTKEKPIHTNRIKRSVNNLTTILNEFLSLQKLEENKVKVVRTHINIPEFIHDDLIGEMDVVKRVGQTIAYSHDGDSNMAYLDHHLLWSIITNLLSNSLKYSKPGDKIQIQSEVKGNALYLGVIDEGIGIPADEHQYIFGRFYRARNALNIEGTGLGLHIVQKYVHLLNGAITFESQLDKGTTFSVTLPGVRVEENGAPTVSS